MAYEVHTPLFEGPLDLLLHLIEKEELDITQLALAQVTDEFLAYVEAMQGRLDIELVADFLVVAARLLWIKSRALLPRPLAASPAASEEEAAGDALLEQLRAYRRYKEAAQWLRERDEAGLRTHVRIARPPRPQRFTLDLANLTLDKLKRVAEAIMYPTEGPRPEDAIQRPRISIVQQIRLIRQRFGHWKQLTFSTLLGRQPTRLEAAVTLQAILELIKQRAVAATQSARFGEIFVEALVPPDQIPEPTTYTEEAPAPLPASQ